MLKLNETNEGVHSLSKQVGFANHPKDTAQTDRVEGFLRAPLATTLYLSTFPVGGNLLTRRKSMTFSRVSNDSIYISVMS